MKQMIKDTLNRLGYDIVRYPDPVTPKIDVFDLVVNQVASMTPDFFFIQIGANDGILEDPIRDYIMKYHWRGVLIEPLPDMFRELVANYTGETQLIFENAAIATEDGAISLFTLDDPTRDISANRFTSLLKGHLVRSFGKDAPIKELKVPALSLASLFSKHEISKVDLLQIDAEGFDYDIIKMFDFNRVKPTIIHFEHFNMSGSRRRETWKYLASLGYSLMKTSWLDTLAFLQGNHN
jgi:FkbM family methyltransferase